MIILPDMLVETVANWIRQTPIAVQADGDIIGTTPVTVKVLPAALSVLVPDNS